MTRSKMINRSILAAVSAGALGTAIALAGHSQAASTSAEGRTAATASVPAGLAVPAGNKVIADFAAQGVQVYQCTGGAWVFLEPAANLIGRTAGPSRTYHTSVHFRGPSWQSTIDGSLVTASVVANAPSNNPNSILQLLLKAATNRGDGLFGKVSYIQRLDTVGGVAPAGACARGCGDAPTV